ncbi:transporter substrate-binding domain-containing protein [Bdellovibrio bacteriovorus]|uniref:substrate-binding periplasmic protein n=1 Tax=Bdellovibrio bacteriovorus TaxID=959 RepID=UPI0021D272BB|nr:transporter substrate-binding domain-containing protein [Bdellovibrio bacteriovorus]UXR66122.1 transporter substrate-binding domain-containing protein [Bdellovibrio bacteriovorus]
MSRAISFLFAAFFTGSISFAAPSMTIVGQDYEPFYFKSGTSGVQGACYEIIQRLCQMEQVHCKFKVAPLRQFLAMLKEGKADIGCPISASPQRETVFFMSPVFSTRYSFFGAENYVKKIKGYPDLKGMKVGVFSPSMTEVSLQKIHEFSDKGFTIQPETTVFVSLRKLQNKAYPLAYLNRDVAQTWIQRTRSQLLEVPNLGESVSYYMAFSKKRFNQTQFSRLEGHLLEMRKNRFLESIAEKYKVHLFDGAPRNP